MPELAAINRHALQGRRRSLVTPEGVDLHLSLADMGQRAGAFILDIVFMLVFLIALTILCVVAGLAFGSAVAIELSAMTWMLGAFALRSFYFILMEMGPRSATFGKRILKIRVVARSGERLTADRVIARNLMREIEFFLPLYFLSYNAAHDLGDKLTGYAGLAWTLLFLLFPFFNKDRLRIGDLLAGTWVIKAPRRDLGMAIAAPASEAFQFSPEQLDVYGIYELQTLETVLRDADPQGMANVAAMIRWKIDWSGNEPNQEFLLAYYQAARARMEHGLLFGRRREDKYDRPGQI
jgi:uncharacterized RDD family membrane protein YckC